MTASTRNHGLIRGFVVGVLAIGALGLTAPLATAQPDAENTSEATAE
jgi:hypothetical protein